MARNDDPGGAVRASMAGGCIAHRQRAPRLAVPHGLPFAAASP